MTSRGNTIQKDLVRNAVYEMRIHVTANEVTYYGMAMSVKRICEVIMRN